LQNLVNLRLFYEPKLISLADRKNGKWKNKRSPNAAPVVSSECDQFSKPGSRFADRPELRAFNRSAVKASDLDGHVRWPELCCLPGHLSNIRECCREDEWNCFIWGH
jgi:hypothetical protein